MKCIIITSFAIGLALTSCVGNNCKNNPQQMPFSENQKQEGIKIEAFTTLPKEIDGCGCFFFLSKEDKQESKYIYVNDIANTAFVFVNGNLEKFELTEHKENSNIYLYASNAFDLKIEITKKEPGGYEVSNVEGVITIKTKDNQKLEKTFIGYCGC